MILKITSIVTVLILFNSNFAYGTDMAARQEILANQSIQAMQDLWSMCTL